MKIATEPRDEPQRDDDAERQEQAERDRQQRRISAAEMREDDANWRTNE